MEIEDHLIKIVGVLKPVSSSLESINKAMESLEDSLSEEDREKLKKIKKEIDVKGVSSSNYSDLASELLKKF